MMLAIRKGFASKKMTPDGFYNSAFDIQILENSLKI